MLIEDGAVVAVNGPLGETAYVVTDPRVAREMLKDPRFVKDPAFAPVSWIGQEITLEPPYEEQRSITTADGHDHALLRRMHAQILSPSTVRDRQPRIAEIAQELLAQIAKRSRDENRPADLMRDFCYQFPLTVIGDLLGVPSSELEQLAAASTQSEHASAEDRVAELMAISAVIDLALNTGASSAVAASLRSSPEFAELGLSEEELTYVLTGIVFAGQETTGAFMGSLLQSYFTQVQRGSLGEDGKDAVVQEALRLYPASTFTLWRFSSVDLELDGVAIPARSPIVVDIEACNMHPATTERDPAEFNPHREHARHLTFGHGPHACLGSRLAEVEAQVVLDTFEERYPAARLDGASTPTWVPDSNVRRLTHLRVWLT